MATNVGDMYVNLKLDIKNLEKGVQQSQKELKKIAKNTKSTTQAFQVLNNNMVRSIRRLETVAVAALGVYHAFDKLIYAGVRLNQQYEDQALGIAALTSAKLKMVDATGKQVTSYEKFLASQQLTAATMDDIKKAALDTPASFQQMIGFYQQTIGHAISANGTFGKSMEDVNKNVITFTQRMSALGSAAGMEMQKINEEIRSLMSGNASTDSLLAMMLFGSPTAANEAVRAAKKNTEGLSKLLLGALAPFKEVQDVMTYTKALAQMNAAMDEVRKGAMTPLFEDIKEAALGIKDYLVKNTEEFIKSWHESYAVAKSFFSVVFDGLSDIYQSMNTLISEILNVNQGFWTWTDTIMAVQQALTLVEIGVNAISLGLSGVKLSVAWAKQLSGYSNDLSDSEKERLKTKKNLLDLFGKEEEEYKKIAKEIEDLESKRDSTSTKEILAAEKERDEVAKRLQTTYGKITEEYQAAQRVKIGLMQGEYALQVKINSAKTEAEAKAAYIAALGGSRKEVDVQEKINKLYIRKIELIKAANKVAGVQQTGGSGAGTGEDTAAAKAARLADKYKRDMIALTTKEAELEVAKLNLYAAQNGLLLTKRQLDSQNLAIATATVKEAEKAYAFAMKQGATDPKAKKALLDLEIKMIKAKTKEAKLLNKTMIDTAKKLQGMGDNVFDSLLEGDFEGAFKSLYDGMMDIFIAPIKEQFTTLFANTFSSLIGGMLDTLVGSMATATAQSIASTTAIGAAAAPAAVASGGAMGGWVGAAAMLALMVGMGLLSNSGSAVSDAELAAAEGITGVQSESVSNVLNSLDWTATRSLTYTKGIYDNISLLVEQSGKAALSLGGLDFNGNDTSSIGGFAGFSSKSSTQLSSGLKLLAGSYDQLRAGIVSGYIETKTLIEKSSWWGLSSSSRIQTVQSNAPSGTLDAIGAAYSHGIEAIKGAARAMGVSTFDELAAGWESSLQNLNFEGKSQEEIARMIEGAIATDLDALSRIVAPSIVQFQQAGEELFETMARVVYEFEAVQEAFKSLGSEMLHFGTYSMELTQDLIAASGGIENLLGNVQGYIDNFYTDAQKQALRISELQSTGLFETEEDYIKYVQRLSDRVAAGHTASIQPLADLLRLQDTYREYFDELSRVEQEILQEILQEKISAAEKELAFHQDILGRIETAYSGTLNYMNSLEKAAALDSIAISKLESGDSQGYFDTLYSQLEASKNTATTREEYQFEFDKYIIDLQAAEYEPKTLDDVALTLDEILEQNKKIEEVISQASYQSPLSTSYTGV